MQPIQHCGRKITTLLLLTLCCFRVGSGAAVYTAATFFLLSPIALGCYSGQPCTMTGDVITDGNTEDVASPKPRGNLRQSGNTESVRKLPNKALISMLLTMNLFTMLACICHMQPGAYHGGALKYPPQWGPDMEPRYTFAQWQREVYLWSIANGDMEPHRQCAMLLLQLRGGARELTRDLPDDVILRGAVINGQRADGITYIMNLLAERYAQLGEETRLRSISDMMEFGRRNHESIDDLLVRFEITRSRAQAGGRLVMSSEGMSWKLLMACGVNKDQMLTLLQPFGNRLPHDEAEMRNLYTALRRIGHVLENAPDNIASHLRRHQGGDRRDAPAYMMTTGNPSSQTNNAENSYWGQNDSQQSDGWNLGSWGNTTNNAYHGMEVDSGTDTDTVSSVGENEYTYEDIPGGLDPVQQGEHLFWAYQQAKGRFRRFMRKPVRRVRRFIKHKGKGRGRHAGHFLSTMSDNEVEEVFFKSGPKGRGKGKRSSGKGRGRRQNPRGHDGQIMKCRTCGSTEHFQKECPKHSGATSPGAPGANYFTYNASEGPLLQCTPNLALLVQAQVMCS